MTGRIILLGATGYTGGLVLEALLRRAARPVLAGRDHAALAAAAERAGGLEQLVVDVTDSGGLQRHLLRGDVLITTVGPFERLGYPVARTAADVGAHYIDSTGEVGFVRALRARLHPRARESGAVMLPAFGYDYVPGTLAGALAAHEAGAAARTLDIGYFADGSLWRGTSRGTRATLRDSVVLPSVRWHERRLVEERTASRTRDFTVRGRRRSAYLVSGTEVLFLPETFRALEQVTVYTGGSELSRLALAALADGAATPAGRALVNALTRPLLTGTRGPDAVLRARAPAHIVALASTGTPGGPPLAEVHLESPNPYSLTGELIAWAADRLASGGEAAPGVVGPVEAFGLGTLRRACDELGLRTL